MATVIAKVATVELNLATQAQIMAVKLIKAVIQCIGGDGNQEYSFRGDEYVVEIV